MRQLIYIHQRTYDNKKVYRFNVERNTEQPEELKATLELCEVNNYDYLVFEKFMGLEVDEFGLPVFNKFNGGRLYSGVYKDDYLTVIKETGIMLQAALKMAKP